MTRLDLYDTRNNHSQTAAWWWEIGEQNAYLIWAAIIRRSREDRGPPQLGWGRVANEKRFKKFQQTRWIMDVLWGTNEVLRTDLSEIRFAVVYSHNFPVFHRSAAIKN